MPDTLLLMRWLSAFLFIGLVLGSTVRAAEGRVYKVLPQFLDLQGRSSLTPSLYDRDAYQNILRRNPARCSGLRFAVQWKARDASPDSLKLRVEMRGIADASQPKRTTVETPVHQHSWFSHWSSLVFKGDDYKSFGEVTAWRVTLWDGDQLLAEQKSFLW